jgi:hypothetical protein
MRRLIAILAISICVSSFAQSISCYYKPNISTHGTFGTSFGVENKLMECDLGINSIFLINRIGFQSVLKININQMTIGAGINLSWIIFRDGTFYPNYRYWSEYKRIGPVLNLEYRLKQRDYISITGLYSPAKLSFRSVDYIGNGINYDELISLGIKIKIIKS